MRKELKSIHINREESSLRSASLELRTSASMAISKLNLLFLFSVVVLSLHRPVLSDNNDEEDVLLRVMNDYRTSINLTTLTPNKNAECLADELAEKFNNHPCTNTTVETSLSGFQAGFPEYPELLTKCRLNITTTRDSKVIPACLPNPGASLAAENLTMQRYSKNLNDSKFTGIGIGHDDNWLVVILTTNTTEGGFSPATTDNNSGGFIFGVNGVVSSCFLVLVFTLFMF